MIEAAIVPIDSNLFRKLQSGRIVVLGTKPLDSVLTNRLAILRVYGECDSRSRGSNGGGEDVASDPIHVPQLV